jgi:hypothetical protein
VKNGLKDQNSGGMNPPEEEEEEELAKLVILSEIFVYASLVERDSSLRLTHQQ